MKTVSQLHKLLKEMNYVIGLVFLYIKHKFVCVQ